MVICQHCGPLTDTAMTHKWDCPLSQAFRNIVQYVPEREEVTDADLERNRLTYNFPDDASR